jgi:hypothetical protein
MSAEPPDFRPDLHKRLFPGGCAQNETLITNKL